MSRGDVSQLLLLLGVPAGCAAVGLLLVPAIGGKPSMVERMRWRLVTSAACLRDAHNSSLSPHTRFK